MTISIWEIVQRAKSGQLMDEKEFDLKVLVPKLREITKKYEIKYDSNNPVPTDDDLINRIYEAALEFYTEVGVYCVDTGRVIKFTKEEVIKALEAAPSIAYFGEGRDQFIMRKRGVEDKQKPSLYLTAFSCATDQETYAPITEAFIMEPMADMVSTPSIKEYNGIKFGVGDPTEYIGATRLAMMFNDARKTAGRPGIAIGNAVSSAVTAAGIIAATRREFGLRPSDGYYTPVISEFKIDMDRLLRNTFMKEWNANIILLFSPILGGMCGGPDTLAVANVAYYLMGATLCNATCFASFPLHFSTASTTHRPTIWVMSASQQAISQNTHLVSIAEVFTRNGPATPEIAYEAAAWAISTVPAGANHGGIGFGGGGERMFNFVNPLDSRLSGEIALGAVSYSREEANHLVNNLIKKYESKLDIQNKGKPFPVLYDLETRQPFPETVDHYNKMKEELGKLGVKFKNKE